MNIAVKRKKSFSMDNGMIIIKNQACQDYFS